MKQLLEDVELVLGLPVDGEVVTGITNDDLISLCEQLLGYIPPTIAVKGNSMNLSWLNNTFSGTATSCNQRCYCSTCLSPV